MIGAITMLLMSLHYLQDTITGIMKGKAISDALWYRIILRTHIVFGLIGILIGPFQFSKRLRTNQARWHKRIGYIYVTSIMISAVAGLIVAQFATGGLPATLGFSLLALAWMIITPWSVIAIKSGHPKRHQLLMMLSYSLTWAAIPQRSMLLLTLITDIPFITIYQYSAWLPWIINMAIAYLIFKYSNKTKSLSHA